MGNAFTVSELLLSKASNGPDLASAVTAAPMQNLLIMKGCAIEQRC
jgi:hypothetical protein